jgi:hypothetical protein
MEQYYTAKDFPFPPPEKCEISTYCPKWRLFILASLRVLLAADNILAFTFMCREEGDIVLVEERSGAEQV